MKDQYFEVGSVVLTTQNHRLMKYLATGRQDLIEGFFFYLIEVLDNADLGSKVKKAVLEPISSFKNSQVNEDLIEKCLEEINDSLGKLFSSLDKQIFENINAVIGFVSLSNIFISQTGNASGFLFRKGKISSLTESPVGNVNPLHLFSDVICGELIKEDRIVIGNNELFNHLSLDRIRKITANPNISFIGKEMLNIFQKLKIDDINTIVLKPLTEEGEEEAQKFYIDEPKESLLQNASKTLTPAAKKALALLKAGFATASKHSKTYAKKTSAFCQDKIQPATKKMLEKSSSRTSDLFSKVKEKGKSLSVDKPKVKTKLYTDKTKKLNFGPSLQYVSSAIRHIFKPKNRKIVYLGLIILLIIFGYSKIRYNNKHRTEIKKSQEQEQAYQDAKNKLQKYSEDKALGKSVDIKQLDEALALARSASENITVKDASVSLSREITKELDSTTKTIRIYPDSSAVALGTKGARMAINDNEIYVFGEDGKVYSIDINDNESKLIASLGKEKAVVTDLVTSETGQLAFVADNKIYSFNLKDRSQTELLPGMTDIKTPTAISFFSSTLYTLDASQGQIYKFVKSSGQYGTPGTYIPSSLREIIKGAVSLAIDGNVYVLSSDGKVFKFTRGQRDSDFAIKNIPEPKSEIVVPKKIFTNAETTYIYILDLKENRVLRFNKAGEFIGQYTLDSQSIKDFVVNEKLKKMWLTSENKVYILDL